MVSGPLVVARKREIVLSGIPLSRVEKPCGKNFGTAIVSEWRWKSQRPSANAHHPCVHAAPCCPGAVNRDCQCSNEREATSGGGTAVAAPVNSTCA